jgi:hypothetical protein
MRVGNFCVDIEGGRELSNSYVAVKPDGTYAVVLKNFDWKRCDAVLTIDGKEIETFRLNSQQTMRVEGPPDDPAKGCFTFYRAGSEAAAAAGEGGVSKNDKGLVTVVFKPEKQKAYRPQGSVVRSVPVEFAHWSSGVPGYGTTASYDASNAKKSVNVSEAFNACEAAAAETLRGVSAGVTGLSGHNDQKWHIAGPIEHDESKFVTINLRLVVADDGPRPLTAKGVSNPVPPPVG